MNTREFFSDLNNSNKFIELWNKGNRDGLQIKMAEAFDTSICTIQRIRKTLNLELLHSGKHPGRLKLLKRIKKLYVKDERSSIQIAKIIRMESQNVLNILHKINVKLRPQKVVNALYYKTTAKITTKKLIDGMKEDFVWRHMTIKAIAEKYGINQGTVSNKLEHMGVKQSMSCRIKVNRPCQWCGINMEYVNVNNGPRKQMYCGSSCKNMAKDYRMMKRGKRVSETRIASMEEFLKTTWKSKFKEIQNRILKK